MTKTWQVYGKFLIALLAALAVAVQSALADQSISVEEWVQVAIQVTTAAGVWLTANLPGYQWAKTATAALLAGLNLLVSSIIDGVSGSEWVNIAIAVVGVLLIAVSPSQTTSVGPPPPLPGSQPASGEGDIE